MQRSNFKLVPIFSHSIVVDKPLIFPLYSHEGILLANKGSKLEDTQSLNLLKHGKIYTLESELMKSLESLRVGSFELDSDKNKPYRFPHVLERIVKLEKTFIDLLKTDAEDFKHEFLMIVNNLESIVNDNHNGAVAKIFLHTNRYPALEYIFTFGILICVMVNHLNWKQKEKNRIILASLSHIVSIFSQTNTQAEHFKQFDEKYNISAINKESVNFLRKRGIQDKKSLSYISNLDFPDKIDQQNKNDELTFAFSLFNFISQFSSLVTGFNHPQWYYPTHAYKMLEKYCKNRYRNYFLTTLVSLIGRYPAGSIVKLQNGEVAIVIHQTNDLNHPMVKILLSNKGFSSRQMPERQTNDGNHQITSIMFSTQIIDKIDFSRLWRN